MKVTHLEASNWRNFKNVGFDVGERLFVVGPNAAGKSNLLDIFRFLADIAGRGGGLASAIDRRGGLKKVRSLFSRNNAGERLVIDVTLRDGDDSWRYRLSVKGEGKGRNRPVVHEELVMRNGTELLRRPDDRDLTDEALLTQTHLEQIASNQRFRSVADYFDRVQYFHLVPQIIRDPSRAVIAGDDPFGSDFIAQMNATAPRPRDAWLRRMQQALRAAVPGFESLTIETDAAGRPHLVAGYKNWRSTPFETERGRLLRRHSAAHRPAVGHHQDTGEPGDPAAGGARALPQQRDREDPALGARAGAALLGPPDHPVDPRPRDPRRRGDQPGRGSRPAGDG